MIVDSNVIFSPLKKKLLSKIKEISGFIASDDLTIVRLYTGIPNTEASVFSKTIFLHKETYDTWKTQEIHALNDKYQTIAYKKERFIAGLEKIEAYFSNKEIDVDEKERLSKIHNFIVNADPTSDRLDSFISDSVVSLKLILSPDDVNSEENDRNFNLITDGNFTDPIPEDELTDYIFMNDDGLSKIDDDFFKDDYEFLEPANKDTESTFFANDDARQGFQNKIEKFKEEFAIFRASKIKRIQEMKSAGFFKDIAEHNLMQTQQIQNLKKIINTVTNTTQVCSECHRETSSSFCQNGDCESISPYSMSYKIGDGVELAFLVKKYTTIVSPYSALSILSNADKETSLSIFASSFKDGLKKLLNENEYGISFVSEKIETEKDQPGKVAVINNGSDIHGEKIEFWDHYQYSGYIYGIIQYEDEIKTPELVEEVEKIFRDRKRTFSEKIDKNYYKNKVIYVVSDYYGQIIRCRKGVLDTSRKGRTLLYLGLDAYSDVIKLETVSDLPNIPGIIYSADESMRMSILEEESQMKGRFLNPMLDVQGLTSEELSEKPSIYNQSKSTFYRLSEGYIYFESKQVIYRVGQKESLKFLGDGQIGRINYITANESIRQDTYTGEKINLYKNFLMDLMFNPNKSAKRFYKNFAETFKYKGDVFEKECFKMNGIIDEIAPFKTRPIFFNKKSQITISSSKEEIEYEDIDLQVYNLNQVTPFFLKELQILEIVQSVSMNIENSQSPEVVTRLNILEDPKKSFNNSMSKFAPSWYKINKDVVNIKQLIFNGLKMSGVEDELTISVDILLKADTDVYQLTLFEEYLRENGILTRRRESEFTLPISTKLYDLISLVL